MEKIKNLVVVMAVAFGISFASGFFDFELSYEMTILIGLVELISIIWLLNLVFKKQ